MNRRAWVWTVSVMIGCGAEVSHEDFGLEGEEPAPVEPIAGGSLLPPEPLDERPTDGANQPDRVGLQGLACQGEADLIRPRRGRACIVVPPASFGRHERRQVQTHHR